MTHVIALTGYAGVGKTTFAERLAAGRGYVHLAFADKLKDLLRSINPIVVPGHGPFLGSLNQQVAARGWDDLKRNVPYVRQLLQDTGMAARDVLGEDVWIKPVIRQAKARGPVVISDLRLPNELDALRGSLFDSVIVLRLTRSGIGPANGHITETPLPHDIEVNLDSVGLADLDEAIGHLMDLIVPIQYGVHRHLRRQLVEHYRDTTSVPLHLSDQFLDAFDEARS
jgi:hypothetical protein